MSQRRGRGIFTGLSVVAVAIALAVSILPGVAAAQSMSPVAAARGHHDSGIDTGRLTPCHRPRSGSDCQPGCTPGVGRPGSQAQPNAEPSEDPNAEPQVYTADPPSDTNTNCNPDPDRPYCEPPNACDPDQPDCQPGSSCRRDQPDCQPAGQRDPDEPDCSAGQPKPEGENENDEIGARLTGSSTSGPIRISTVPAGTRCRERSASRPGADRAQPCGDAEGSSERTRQDIGSRSGRSRSRSRVSSTTSTTASHRHRPRHRNRDAPEQREHRLYRHGVRRCLEDHRWRRDVEGDLRRRRQRRGQGQPLDRCNRDRQDEPEPHLRRHRRGELRARQLLR